MKYTINIDRTSIKKNPNAGNMSYYRYLGPPTVTETFVNGILVSKSIKQNCETLHSLTPEPEYYYSHDKSAVIECDLCDARFCVKHLEEDWDDEGNCIKNICPVCKGANCCEIEYEKFDKSMVEKN